MTVPDALTPLFCMNRGPDPMGLVPGLGTESPGKKFDLFLSVLNALGDCFCANSRLDNISHPLVLGMFLGKIG